jgi:hypothetical protein
MGYCEFLLSIMLYGGEGEKETLLFPVISALHPQKKIGGRGGIHRLFGMSGSQLESN